MSFNNSQYCYNSSNQAKLPITPGAYGFGTSNSFYVKMLPIYGNIPIYSEFSANSIINKYLILPGYSLTVYSSIGYVNIIDTYDNTTGTTVMFIGSAIANSCELFYDNNQLGYMDSIFYGGEPVNVTVGNFNKFPYTINASNDIVEPLFPGAYFFNNQLSSGENLQNKIFPIYGCIKNYNAYEIGTLGGPTVYQTYLVLPEFQLLTYNDYNWTTPPETNIEAYVNYSGNSYMFNYAPGVAENDNSCTLGFKSNDSPNNTVLGLMNRLDTSQSSSGWTAWSGFPDSYPGSFKNGPIFYTTPSNTPFPPTPFAWAFVQDGNTTSIKVLPIFGSIPDYTYYSNFNDTVDAYLVLPGFCLITFNAINWDTGDTYYDNRLGNDYLYIATDTNNDSSCLLFYKGLNNTTNLLGLQSLVV